MHVTEVTDGIFRLSANAKDILFEGIWPIPNGVSMNSYIVKGEKVAIVDGVCGWDGVPETLFTQLDQMKIKAEDIDYVIINHHEPDHSGWLDDFKKIRKDFQIITSVKGEALLEAFYEITDNIRTVKTGDTLDLGDGRVLAFADIPNVHWPETMATFDTKSGTLLPCDAFGSFGAITDAPYDDQLSDEQIEFFEQEAVRYYANIVAAFSLPTSKAIKVVEGLPVKIIAPGHGIVWRKNPQKIVDDYKRYASYSKGPAKEEVTVIWGSMYGMTEQGVRPVIEGLQEGGVVVHEHRVPESPLGDILASVWTSTGVVLAMPTYEYKMFPPMAAVLDELGKKKVLNRKAFRFGSYGWSGGAQKELDEITQRLKMNWDFLEPVEFKGKPSPQELDLIKQRGRELAEAVKSLVADAPGA
ncbi:FprA family A-type flavoprotein [Spirochaeta lutea]|uniref:Beta-lactamase n=1 Tax=Spirochaeta lutea TaxID=1480694 RepID=A0A098QYD9_9SPIO|nr:FprA family A-type flavoprotein [Spirochaeta lutea]KGE72443.1 beta-lactamase [Spirochaeta lutea]